MGEEGVSCSRAAVINISTKLGSIGLCLRVPEAPMYPYWASKAELCLFQDAHDMVTKLLVVELQGVKGLGSNFSPLPQPTCVETSDIRDKVLCKPEIF
ncbi:hypothetical protein HGM15179_001251 [Zosterops borbonicus]|uniref:Uncharacterized protein n=1 Tax=Zosterops borbonicus TaxID=364589 RepID=A0A8K1GUZ9_9PASS|nr:hypothetical protein HGM15179_001251 [Zosterops borbonicus]